MTLLDLNVGNLFSEILKNIIPVKKKARDVKRIHRNIAVSRGQRLTWSCWDQQILGGREPCHVVKPRGKNCNTRPALPPSITHNSQALGMFTEACKEPRENTACLGCKMTRELRDTISLCKILCMCTYERAQKRS